MDRAFRVAAMAMAVVAGSALPASAQNALGDGRALDANLSTQGRTNTRVKDVEAQIRFNQRLVEGQVGGGRSFRDSIGYRATDEFGDRLGSSDLYSFRRDSTSGDIAALPGLRTSDALRYQFGLTGGGGARSAGLPSSASELYISRLGAVSTGSFAPDPSAPRQSGYVTSLRSLAQYQAVSAVMPTVLGFTGTEETGRVAITASPLRGMGVVVAMPPPLKDGVPSARYYGAGLTGMERRVFGIDAGQSDARRGSADAIESASIQQRLNPDGTPYTEVTEALSRAISQRFEPAEARPSTPTPSPADKPPATGTDGADQRPEWMRVLDRMRDELQGRPAPARPAATPDAPDARAIGDARPDEVRDKILDALRSMRERIETYTPTDGTAASYVQSMADAEARLAAGDYFSAEGAFSMALIAKPRDPTARIGRVHAQIGAGLFLSAAGGLRDLLADRPEMAPTLYALKLLPHVQRCEEVVARIRADLKNPESGLGADGALLIAYLGRQLENRAWVEEGLRDYDLGTTDSDRAGRALGSLLRSVWATEPEPPPIEK